MTTPRPRREAAGAPTTLAFVPRMRSPSAIRTAPIRRAPYVLESEASERCDRRGALAVAGQHDLLARAAGRRGGERGGQPGLTRADLVRPTRSAVAAVTALVALVVVALPTSFSTLAALVLTRTSSTPRPLAADRSRNVVPTCISAGENVAPEARLSRGPSTPTSSTGRARRRLGGAAGPADGGRRTARDHDQGGEDGHGRRPRTGGSVRGSRAMHYRGNGVACEECNYCDWWE